MADVTWLPVLNTPGYEVSSDGQVRSLTRFVHRSDGITALRRGRILSQCMVGVYKRVKLGQYKRAYVHVLVCEAFHGPRPAPKHEARHLNGNQPHGEPGVGHTL